MLGDLVRESLVCGVIRGGRVLGVTLIRESGRRGGMLLVLR